MKKNTVAASPNDRNTKVNVAAWCGLSERQLQTKLMPLCRHDRVNRLFLFRRFPAPTHPKLTQVNAPRLIRWSAVLSMLWIFASAIVFSVQARKDQTTHYELALGITAFPHGLLAKLNAKLVGAQSAVWWIGTDLYRQFKNPIIRPMYCATLRNSDLTITMGSASKALLVARGWQPNKTLPLMNEHDLQDFSPRSLKKRWHLIYVGRLDRHHKRLDLLLRSVSIAKQEFPKLSCAIVGAGPDLNRLQKLRNQLNLSDSVEFLGARKDIPDLLNQSQAFIMTSAWEGLPAAMIEALACGLPLIVPAVSDIPDLAKHNVNALLIEAQKPQDFARAIVSMMKDKSLYDTLVAGALETREQLKEGSLSTKIKEFWSEVLSK